MSADVVATEAQLRSRIRILELALRLVGARIKVWQVGVECGVKPTPETLANAAADIRDILKTGAA